ncbi:MULTISPECIES: DUF5671 domain-containing protein [unclassified Methanoculleus]|uniref:DUF5671 domain-containing protein n=1 Tax=unclassified Methanoculleus TaxID=2619537 RepID=UPI0025D13D81|nr:MULTISPECIES: DUF5671 domain-containing protein [unclassified Methanoculleus]MCK9318282.1 DUF5671 domain-containing protein [Methanoculleus sp.]MDD2253610.1 DUF5671 domain-containing protein [Methanoculleus sp.]MDD2788274.1 DUF5671 domain-containing protein [Methanoculleus sp.]MDD3216544.1 DUF5671 domain-containing protein [Methanoculleus sp.]MDD4314528.1 DUF5671 domain-containing protein [Methanoculleus sp.]
MVEGLTAWRAYLYAVSFVALIVAIAGSVGLIAVAIEVFIYPPPQPYPVPEYYPGLPGSVAQVAVGLVVWAYHWRLLLREH